MYSIVKDRHARKFQPVNPCHFMPSAPSSASQCIHFSYRLEDLQKEIEKRTFYLGKFRTGQNGEVPHLLDLIGMSRDEGELLYSFVKAAMADVFDGINQYTLHIPKEYVWKKPTAQSPINVSPIPTVSLPTLQQTTKIGTDGESVIISATMTDTTSPLIDGDKYSIAFDETLTLETEVISTVDGSSIKRTRVICHHVDEYSVRCTDALTGQWIVLPQTIVVQLDEQTEYCSSEKIVAIKSVGVLSSSVVAKEKEPTMLHTGDLIVYNNKEYEMVVDTDTNHFGVTKDAMLFDKNNTMSDGIHYYMEVPCYINDTAAEPLDTAILEALVNRIIWKWLILSYPNEAAAYDTIYKECLNSIRMRCNVFNKTWQKTPRIL